MTLLGEGDFSTAYLVNDRYVVRIPKHAEAARALEREACVLLHIGPGLSVPTPTPSFLGDSDRPGRSLAIHELIPGTELTRERWLAFPEHDRVRLARTVGAVLKEVHVLDISAGRGCGLPEAGHEEEIIDLLDRLDHTERSEFPQDLRSSLQGCLREEGELFARMKGGYRPSLLHGDLSPGHVLVNEAKRTVTGIIDWGDAMIGDPARDLIFFYEDWGWDFLVWGLEGYGGSGEEGEVVSGFRNRILFRYLVDQLAWTLTAGLEGRREDLLHGIQALGDGLRDYHLSRAIHPSHGDP